MMTVSIGINLARAGLGETLGSAGCEPALAGSLPASFVQKGLGYSTRVPASCRDRQAGSLRSQQVSSEQYGTTGCSRFLFNLDLARLGFTMPELAEVEYFRRQWNAGIGNRVMKIAQHADKRVFRGTDTRALRKEL